MAYYKLTKNYFDKKRSIDAYYQKFFEILSILKKRGYVVEHLDYDMDVDMFYDTVTHFKNSNNCGLPPTLPFKKTNKNIKICLVLEIDNFLGKKEISLVLQKCYEQGFVRVIFLSNIRKTPIKTENSSRHFIEFYGLNHISSKM